MVTAESVPPVDLAMVTVPPLMVKGIPAAFFKVTVIVEVEVPLARMLVGLALIEELAVVAADKKSTFSVFEAVLPLMAKEIVEVTFVVLLLLVSVAV